jgi:hypothetical protein
MMASEERIIEAVRQLSRSDRGRTMLVELEGLLSSSTVAGLDGPNSAAVAFLVRAALDSGPDDFNRVMAALRSWRMNPK